MEIKNIITIIVCLVVGVFLYDIFVFGNNDILSVKYSAMPNVK